MNKNISNQFLLFCFFKGKDIRDKKNPQDGKTDDNINLI